MAKAISETHEIGKYPVQEKKERRNHLLRNLGIGGGIAAGVASLFLGYKALTNNNQVSTEEFQRALAPQDKKVEVVKKNYGQEAVKDLNAGVLPIEDYSSKYEIPQGLLKDYPNLDQNFWNSIYKALIKYDSKLADKHFTIVGIKKFGLNETCKIIGWGEDKNEIKKAMKMSYPNFKEGLKIGIMFDDRDLSRYIFIREKDGISVYRETVR